MKKTALVAMLPLLLAPGLVCPTICRADTLLIGQISFDSGVSPDGNTFDLYNLTGGLIDPDGIVDNEVFSGTLAVMPVGGSTTVYTFSDIDDTGGPSGGTIATLLSSEQIASATLSLTLGNSSGVNIYDDSGNPAVVDLLGVSDPSLPLNGSLALTPCDGSGSTCSSAAIYVDTAPPVSPVPEPGTVWLALAGLGGLAAVGRRIRRM